MKRAIAVFCVTFLLVFCSVAFAESDNLLNNGGFEEVTTSDFPVDWYPTAYRNQTGYSRMAVTDESAHSGQRSVVIENASSNDARFIYTVKVKPESLYKLSGYVLIDHMEATGNGANFGIEGIYSFSECLFDTNKQWKYLEWYGETGEDQTELTIGVRVGGYSAESIGKAYFDDIVLEEVNELPQGIIASLWYNANIGGAAYQPSNTADDEKQTHLFVIMGLFFALIVFLLKPTSTKSNKDSFFRFCFICLFLLAFIIRVIIAIKCEGYQVDINCFKAWSLRMASKGPLDFYAPDYFCDYPPGAMLLLWPVGLLLQCIGLENNAAVLLIVKMLPVLCDLLGALLLYRFALKNKHSVLQAVCVSALYLFTPAALVNGAGWGQMDSVLAILILITTLSAMAHNWCLAVPMFVIAVLVKPQALLFAPLGGIALLIDFVASKGEDRIQILKKTLEGIGLALAAALLIVVPFSLKQEHPFTWLFDLYGNTLGSYAYATLNTANLYYLAGANWTGLAVKVPHVLYVIPACIFAALGICLYLKAGNNGDIHTAFIRKCVSGLMALMCVVLCLLWIFDANYQLYGYLMMVFAYIFVIICYLLHHKAKGSLSLYMSLALVGIYVLGIKVHERYLFPALILLLVSYICSRDRRVLWLFAGFSATTFINTSIVLENSILFGAEMGHLNQDTLLINQALCIVNLFLCIYGGWIGIEGLQCDNAYEKGFSHDHTSKDRKASYMEMLLNPRDHRLNMNLRDFLIMGITTAAYAVLAFYQLGSTVAPQTAWVSTNDSESVILELDETTTFSVLYYAGVSYNDFAIAVSDDGEKWSESYPCEMREGLCYRWNYALKATTADGKTNYPTCSPSNVLWLTGKYLRIDACDAGLNLWEIVARDENGNNLSFKLVDHVNARPELLNENKPAAHLIDETDTCIGQPSWYNGTYFDEIYHARTAYEHLHGQAPYETTHPPLGKLMMSAAIAVFGMTPFGWRFAGALIGVLMLPAIYLLALQLVHKRSVAVASMLAFALDLMHYTQTRIATIDSFPVFFILLTYLFMIRYMQMDAFAVSDPESPRLFDKNYVKTLIPLFLCGICMGLSIACKWIGIYSAVGLAVLFFATMYRHFRASEIAWEMSETENCNERILCARSFTIHRIAITCGFCILFFVVIPCIIYGLSYVPYLSPTGPVTLKRIIRAQENMLSYHAEPGRGMDHPFYSPWWQWPFLLKPMWFVQDQFEPAGYASTILCFGNPWVFYIGAFSMMAVLICCITKYVAVENGRISIRHVNGDLTFVILCVAFLVQYLPWVVVPRGTYMYHYFASVPFIIIATAVMMDKTPLYKKVCRKVMFSLYLVGALLFFIMFFPYASGYLTNIKWLDAMKWFSKLYY